MTNLCVFFFERIIENFKIGENANSVKIFPFSDNYVEFLILIKISVQQDSFWKLHVTKQGDECLCVCVCVCVCACMCLCVCVWIFYPTWWIDRLRELILRPVIVISCQQLEISNRFNPHEPSIFPTLTLPFFCQYSIPFFLTHTA